MSLIPVAVTSVSGAHKRLLTKLRVHHGLLVASMVEGHHEGAVSYTHLTLPTKRIV